MSAIITDKLRILNCQNFISGINTSSNSYYLFIGLTNPTDYASDWNQSPIPPKDNLDEENSYWDSMVALKKINPDDVRQVVRRINWESGITYDMYRHDVSRDNKSKSSDATNLYLSNFYVVNRDYRVYICLYNGISPENPKGRPSLDEPTFTDLEPKPAGNSGDGYIWKYLYTISPSEINKFVTTEYIPVPKDWNTNPDVAPVRDNAITSGQLKMAVITNRGDGLNSNTTYTNIPIKGDGSNATATIVINNNSKVELVTISNGGDGYTYGTLDLESANVPIGNTKPQFDVIIPPRGGHGFNIYNELGAYKLMIYSRIENDINNPDFITGNVFARIGIVQNPLNYDSDSILNNLKVSGVYALKLIGPPENQDLYKNTLFIANDSIEQNIGLGKTAVGRVISYDPITGVLKYWQDRTLVGFTTSGSRNNFPDYGFEMNKFTSDSNDLSITGGSSILYIDNNFGTNESPGISTVINNRTYSLGQSFIQGLSNPEVKKYSGNIIHVDNRSSITRSPNQKEDIKIVLQF